MNKRIIYGTMGIGGDWDNKPLEQKHIKKAFEAISAALEVGITTFDFADIYNLGKSEKVFGLYLEKHKDLRSKLFLQSKVGIDLFNNKEHSQYNFSYDYIISQVKKSLENLKTDYLDALLLHRMDPLIDGHELKKAIDYLFNRGMIKSLGVSNMNYKQMELISHYTKRPLKINQLEMSLKKHDFLDSTVLINTKGAESVEFPFGTLEYCMMNKIELQAWSPLSQGMYSLNHSNLNNKALCNTRLLLEKLSKEKNTSIESILLAWLMKPSMNIRPVIGTSSADRIKNLKDAEDIELSREEWYNLYISARGESLP